MVCMVSQLPITSFRKRKEEALRSEHREIGVERHYAAEWIDKSTVKDPKKVSLRQEKNSIWLIPVKPKSVKLPFACE
uniref:Transposase n=1 Tax=Panagrellus redivivus TaxID=6233 RepID=A0A7E4VDW3_PANRE